MKQEMPDACPRCLTIGYPRIWRHDRGSVLAFYTCRKCGRKWKCWWNPSSLEVTRDDRSSLTEVQTVPH